MQKKDVQIGETYAVKVIGKIQPVTLTSEERAGGWWGTNKRTNRRVQIRTAAKLRHRWINVPFPHTPRT